MYNTSTHVEYIIRTRPRINSQQEESVLHKAGCIIRRRDISFNQLNSIETRTMKLTQISQSTES
jgi:hypothetical protein